LGDLKKDPATQQEKLVWESSTPKEEKESLGTDGNRSSIASALTNNAAIPWHYKNKNIGVALTGKAFNYIQANRGQYEYLFLSVLAKAQVYARMSPDDKANLVDSI
jgi:magnesium-transporting ATPase (P-type)